MPIQVGDALPRVETLTRLVDGRDGGMGIRSQRHALIAEDGVVRKLFVEKPGGFEASKAESVLAAL